MDEIINIIHSIIHRMSPLRKRTFDYMRLKGYSLNTIKSYINHISRFAQHFKQCPSRLSLEEVQDYLLYLVQEKGYSQPTINGAYSALKLLFENILAIPWDAQKIPRTKKKKTLPTVLSIEEVQLLFEVTQNIKHKSILMMLYSTGLRLSELAQLKISAIDSKRMLVKVLQGKGRKDRYTILSEKMLLQLRLYYKKYRPKIYLFNGAYSTKPISIRTIQSIFHKAKQRANIKKAASVHTLRHCFATHLIESGVSIAKVQLLLGHKRVTTTSRYLHLSTKHLHIIKHPMD